MYFITENSVSNLDGEVLDMTDYPSDKFEDFLMAQLGYVPDVGHNNILNLTLILLEQKPEQTEQTDKRSETTKGDWSDVESIASVMSLESMS